MRRSEGLLGFFMPWLTSILFIAIDYFNPSWFFRKRFCLGISGLEWRLRCHDFFDLLFLLLPLLIVVLVAWGLRRWKKLDGLSAFAFTALFGLPGTLAFFLMLSIAMSGEVPRGFGEDFFLVVLFIYVITLIGVAGGALAPSHVPVEEETHDEGKSYADEVR
ncbi:hypothetical protein [Thermococcus sp.]